MRNSGKACSQGDRQNGQEKPCHSRSRADSQSTRKPHSQRCAPRRRIAYGQDHQWNKNQHEWTQEFPEIGLRSIEGRKHWKLCDLPEAARVRCSRGRLERSKGIAVYGRRCQPPHQKWKKWITRPDCISRVGPNSRRERARKENRN